VCCGVVKNQKELNAVVGQVLKQEMPSLFGTDSAATLNAEFLARNSTSLPHIVAGCYLRQSVSSVSPAFRVYCYVGIRLSSTVG